MRVKLTPLLLCGMLITCASAEGHGSHDRASEVNDVISEMVRNYEYEAKGCDPIKARQCFLAMANATLMSVGERDSHKREMWCKEVYEKHQCIENSMKACPMTDGSLTMGMRALGPFLPLMKSIMETSCMAEERKHDEEDMRGCDLDGAAQCMMGFFYVAADASTSMTCWQAHHSVNCLSASMHSCRNKQLKGIESIVLSQLKLTTAATCPKRGCNVAMATECMMMARAATDDLLTLYQSPMLCGVYMTAKECAMEYLEDCEEDKQKMFSKALLHLHLGIKAMCHKESDPLKPTDNDLLINLRNFQAVTNSPFASKEVICPYYRAGMKKLIQAPLTEFSLENIMTIKTMATGLVGDMCDDEDDNSCSMMSGAMCSRAEADKCMETSQISFYKENMDILGKEMVCKEVLRVAACVDKSISGCRMDQLPDENFKFWKVMGVVAEYCPIPAMISQGMKCQPKTCKVSEAMGACFHQYTADDIRSGNACMYANKSISCVRMHTAGCKMSTAVLPLKYILYYYLNDLKPYCPIPEIDYLRDDMVSVTMDKAMWKSMDALTHILYNTYDFKRDMCHLLMSMGEAVEDIRDKDPKFSYGLKRMYEHGAGLYKHMCSGFKEEDLKNMSKPNMTALAAEPTCGKEVAAGCISIHFNRMLSMDMMPIGEKHSVCYGYKYVEECVMNNITKCSDERKEVFKEAWEMVGMMQWAMCPVDPTAKYMMMDHGSCAPETALFCANWLLKQEGAWSPYNRDESCMAYSHVMDCMRDTLQNCTATDITDELRTTTRDLVDVFQASCITVDKNCNSTTAVKQAVFKYDPPICKVEALKSLYDLFDDVKDYLKKHSTFILCSFERKIETNGNYLTMGCNQENKTFHANKVQEIKASLKNFSCNSERYFDLETCPLFDVMPVCSLYFDECFPSENPNDICGNATAIRACISLHLRGCTKDQQYQAAKSMYNMIALLNRTQDKCDIVPTTLAGEVLPNYAMNSSCLGFDDLMKSYLFSERATEKNICKSFKRFSECLTESTEFMGTSLRSYYNQLATSIKEQLRARCQLTNDLALIFDEEPVNITQTMPINETTCNVPEASMCLGDYLKDSFYAGFTTLLQRRNVCEKRKKSLACVNEKAKMCPKWARARMNRIVDWTHSIMQNFGVCSQMEPRECNPQEALKCITSLSEAYAKYGQVGACPALLPVRKCAIHQTNGCEDNVRLNIEYTFKEVSLNIMEKCEKMEPVMQKEGKCDEMKVKHCMKKTVHEAWELVSEGGDRMEKCREIKELWSCAEENMKGCKDTEVFTSHMPLIKSLVVNVCSTGGERFMMKNMKKDEKQSHCLMTAGGCMDDFLKVSMEGALEGICMQMPSTTKCMMSALKTCHPVHQELLHGAVNQLSMVNERLCAKKGCNVPLAMSCLNTVKYLMNKGADKLKDSALVCSGLKEALTCMGNYTMSCRAEEHPFLKDNFHGYMLIAEKMCGPQTYNPMLMQHPDAVTLFSLLALTSNPFVKKEDVCPQATAMAKYIEEMKLNMSPEYILGMEEYLDLPNKIIGTYCDMEENNKKTSDVQQYQCDAKAAQLAIVKCAATTDLSFRVLFQHYTGWSPVCKSVNKLACCIINELPRACTYDAMKMAISTIQGVQKVTDKNCPMEDVHKYSLKACPVPPAKKCTVSGAMKCLPILTDSTRGAICSNWPTTQTCITHHLEGCHSLELTSFNFFISKYYPLVNCQTFAAVNTQVVVKDSFVNVTKCYMDFAEAIYSGLKSTTHFPSTLCKASFRIQACLEHAGEIPVLMQYVLTQNKQLISEGARQYCYQEKEGTCPAVGSNLVGICVHECVSDTDCDGYMKCCSNGCGKVCRMPRDVAIPAELPVSTTCRNALEVASSCVSSYTTRLATWRTTPLAERKQLCAYFWNVTNMCVNHPDLNDCPATRKAAFTEAGKLLMIMHEEACPSLLAPLFEEDAGDFGCQSKVAEHCVEMLGTSLFTASYDSSDEICDNFQKTMKCVKRATQYCAPEVGLSIVKSMKPLMSMVGNTCMLASAISCDVDRWADTVTHATCDIKMADHLLEYLGKKATDKDTSQQDVCMTFEKIMMNVSISILTCEPESVKHIFYILTPMMETYGKSCWKAGLFNKTFTDMIMNHERCMSLPTCSLNWHKCLPESMNATDICRNASRVKECMTEKLDGCDPHLVQGSLASIENNFKQLPCDVIPVLNYTEETGAVKRIQSEEYPCLSNLSRSVKTYLHGSGAADQPLCDMFHEFSMCAKNHQGGFSGIMKGVNDMMVAYVSTYTKIRCQFIGIYENATKEAHARMNKTMTQTNQTKPMAEPKGCDVNLAYQCMDPFVSTSIFVGFHPIKDRMTNCKDLMDLYMCVKQATDHCSVETRTRFMKMKEWAARLTMSMNICPQMSEEGDIMPMHKPVCEVREAMECLHDLSRHIIYYKDTIKSAICSKVQPTASCVLMNTWGCSLRERNAVEYTFMDLATVAHGICYANMEEKPEMDDRMSSMPMDMSKCPGTMMEKDRKCNMAEAMFCVTTARSKIMGRQSEENVCKALMHMKECVKEEVSGCQMCHLEGLHKMMARLEERVNCPALKCDMCGAAMCAKKLEEHAKMKDGTCVDVWKAQQCVETKMHHCPRNNQTMMVSMTMANHMKYLAKSMCEYPDNDVEQCSYKLAYYTNKILGLSKNLQKMFDMETDKMSNDTKPQGNTTRTEARADDKGDDDKMEMDSEKYNPSEQLLKNAMKNLMGMKTEQMPCGAGKDMGMEDMSTMCESAKMAFLCVKTSLYQVQDEPRAKVIAALLPIIKEAVTAKCLAVENKKGIRCFSCKSEKSNDECNMHARQMCHRDEVCITVREKGYISKGCTRSIPLLQKSECLPNGKCVHICDTDSCNYPEDKPIREHETCNPRAAMACGMRLTHHLMTAYAVDCGKATEAMTCVYKHTQGCLTYREEAMHMMAEKFLHSPMSIKCIKDGLKCRCGSCNTVLFAKTLHSPLVTYAEKCRAAMSTHKDVMSALLMEDCSMDDLKRLKMDAHLLQTVMGNMCAQEMPMGDFSKMTHMSPVCDLDGAHACYKMAHVEELMAMNVHKEYKDYFCSTAKKMMLCMYWNTVECDSDKMNKDFVNDTQLAHLKMMMNHCDFELMNTKDRKAMLNDSAPRISMKIQDRVAEIQGKPGDKAMMLAKTMYVMTYGGMHAFCKPSLALHKCFDSMEGTDFCGVAQKRHECIMMLTSGCTWVQKSTVVHLFHMYVSEDKNKCGFSANTTDARSNTTTSRDDMVESRDMNEEIMKDPYHELAMCMSTYSTAMHKIYTNPDASYMEKACDASYKLDGCLYKPDLSPVGRLYLNSVTMMSQHMIELTCHKDRHLPRNCSRDDKLCQNWDVAMNMTQPDDDWWKFKESAECKTNEASSCLSVHMIRVLSSPFSSLEEFQHLCWDQMQVMKCVDDSVQKCSAPRQKVFKMAAESVMNITQVYCDEVIDTSTPNCSTARYCIDHMMGYAVSAKAYMNPDRVCWGLEKVSMCVEHHGPACSVEEMKYIKSGVNMLGNLTYGFCPEHRNYLCELSMMPAQVASAPCNRDGIQSCIDTFFNRSYNQNLTRLPYCRLVDTTKACLERETKNCLPYVRRQVADLMTPAIAQYYNNNCTRKWMADYDTMCPLYLECSIVNASEVLENISNYMVAEKLRASLSDDAICGQVRSQFLTPLSAKLKQCNSLEVTILNQLMDYIVQLIGLKCTTPLALKPGFEAKVLDGVNQCAKQMFTDMRTAVLRPQYGYRDFCPGAKNFNSCVTDALMKESSAEATLLGHLMKPVGEKLTAFYLDNCMSEAPAVNLTPVAAEAGCDVDTAFSYVGFYSLQALFMPVLKGYDQMALCKGRSFYRKFVNDATAKCTSPVIKQQLLTALGLHEGLVMSSGKCDMQDMMMYMKEMSETMLGGDMMNEKMDKIKLLRPNMGVLPKAVIASIKEMYGHGGDDDDDDDDKHDMEDDKKEDDDDNDDADDDDDDDKKDDMEDDKKNDMEDDDEKDEMEDMECDARMAMECFIKAMDHISTTTYIRNQSVFCGSIERAGRCVKDRLEKCDHMTKVSVHHNLAEFAMFHEYFCDDDNKMGMGDDDKMDQPMGDDDMMDRPMGDDMQAGGAMDNKWIDTTAMFEPGMMRQMNEDMKMMADSMPRDEDKKGFSEEDIQRMMREDLDDHEQDPYCISSKKYAAHATCNPGMALKAFTGMFEVTSSPYSTNDKICLTQAYGLRVLIASTYGCKDYLSQNLMHQMYMLAHNRFDGKCKTQVKESCMDDRKCQPMKIVDCYNDVKMQVENLMMDKVDPNFDVCMELGRASKCAEYASKDCPGDMVHQTFDKMEPALSTLVQICTHVPQQYCAANALWKMAALTLTQRQMYGVGALIHYFEYSANDTKTKDDTNTERQKRADPASDKGMSAEDTYKVLMTVHNLLGRHGKCSEDMMQDPDLVTGFMHLIRYAYMYNDVIPKEKTFMSMMTTSILHEAMTSFESMGDNSGNTNQELGALVRYVAEKAKEMAMHNDKTRNDTKTTSSDDKGASMDVKADDIIGKVITQLITVGDSMELLSHAVHKGFKAEMMKAMHLTMYDIEEGKREKMEWRMDMEKQDDDKDNYWGSEDRTTDEDMDDNKAEDMTNDSGNKTMDDKPADDKSEDDKSADDKEADWKRVLEKDGQIKTIADSVLSMISMEMTNMSPSMKPMLKESLDYLHMNYGSLCLDVLPAHHCIEKSIEQVPESVRGAYKALLGGMFDVFKYFCEPQKCYSCNDVHDNGKCNEQGMKTCGPGQTCYTYVDNGKVSKGCTYVTEKKMDDPAKSFEICYGSKCNQPKYGTLAEDEKMCKPWIAVHSMSEMVPLMLNGRELDTRQMYKLKAYIDMTTSGCVWEEHRSLSEKAMKIENMIREGQCSGPEVHYTCGMRNILSFAHLLTVPSATRPTICKSLNHVLDVVKTAVMTEQCSEYEMVMAYEALSMVYKIMPQDYCPGLSPTPPNMCDMGMRKTKPMCDVQALPTCMESFTTLKSWIDSVGDIISINGVEKMCRLVAHSLSCVDEKTSACTASKDKDDVHKFVEENLGMMMSHCPAIMMHVDLCSNETKSEEKHCYPLKALTTCVQATGIYENISSVCSLTNATIDKMVECVGEHTSGCTAVQAISIPVIMQWIMTNAVMACAPNSTISPIFTNPTLKNSNRKEWIAPMDMIMHMYATHGIGAPKGGRDNMPMTQLVNQLITLKHHNTSGGRLAKHVGQVLSGKVKVENPNMVHLLKTTNDITQYIAGKHASRIWHTDDTHGVAGCLLEFETHFKRALIYTKGFNVLMCEALTNAEMCLKKLSLSPVSHMYVMSMVSEMANVKDETCQTYMDSMVYLGGVVMQKTMEAKQLMNYTKGTALTKDQAELMDLLKKSFSNTSMSLDNMTNGMVNTLLKGLFGDFMIGINLDDLKCDRSYISSELSFFSLIQMVGGFNNFATYPTYCQYQKSVFSTLLQMIPACDSEAQLLYYNVLSSIYNQSKSICELDYFTFEPVSTCASDAAYYCLMKVVPYVSTLGSTDRQVCGKMEEASICTGVALSKCSDEVKGSVYLFQNHLMSIIGDRCPYLSEAMRCNVQAAPVANPICNETLVKTECVNPILMERSPADQCRRLPEMMNCFYKYMSGCSTFAIHNKYEEVHVRLQDVYAMCRQDNMIEQFKKTRKDCAVPDVCEIEAAVTCMTPLTVAKDCSVVASVNQCLEGSIKGCSIAQRLILMAPYALLDENIQKCPINFLPGIEFKAYQDAAQYLGQCTVTFVHSLANAMTSQDKPYHHICEAFHTFANCSDVSAPYGNSYNASWEIVKALCNSDDFRQNKIADISPVQPARVDGCDMPTAARCLSAYAVPAMLSSIMPRDDLNQFCAMKGPTELLLACVEQNVAKCPNNSQALLPMSTVGSALHAVIHLSEVCSNELWTCSPEAAMNCGNEAVEKVMGGKAYDNTTMCRIWDEYYSCGRRNTWMCDNKEEVQKAFKMEVETSLCMFYDGWADCPSVKQAMNVEYSDMPDCPKMDKSDHSATCDMGAALMCVSVYSRVVTDPHMTCGMMNKQYTDFMVCIGSKTLACDEGQKMTGQAIIRHMVMSTYEKCPKVVTHPCKEHDGCLADEALHSAAVMHHLLETPMPSSYKCVAKEMAHLIVKEKTKECSVLTREGMVLDMLNKVPAELCKTNMQEVCVHKLMMNSLAIIQGEVTLADMERTKGKVSVTVNKHFMQKTNMADWDGVSDKVEEVIGMMRKTKKSMWNIPKELMSVDNYTQNFDAAYMYWWDMLTGGSEYSPDIVQAKAKVVKCAALQEAMTCVENAKIESTWINYPKSQVKFISENFKLLYTVGSNMCSSDETCNLLNEPESCGILPALYTTAMQLTEIMNFNSSKFCRNLPLTIQFIKNATSTCTNATKQYFQAGIDLLVEARDKTICKSSCNADAAKKCLDDYEKNPTCPQYEVAVFCLLDQSDCTVQQQNEWNAKLQQLYDPIAPTCKSISRFNVEGLDRINTLVEGTPMVFQMSLQSPPQCGDKCEIRANTRIQYSATAQRCDGDVTPQLKVLSACEIRFTSQNWNQKQDVVFAPLVDGIDSSEEVTVYIDAVQYSGDVAGLSRRIGEYKVTVTNVQPADCSISQNSLISSFDEMSHQNREQGSFILYKSTDGQYEVYGYNQPLYTNTITHCAAFIKIDDDILVIQNCRTRNGRVYSSQLFVSGSLSPGVQIFETTNTDKVTVMLPTGTMISVEKRTNGLFTRITAASTDMGRTTGLCGVYNNDPTDDYVLPNGRKLQADETAYLDEQWKSDTIILQAYTPPTTKYCTCMGSASDVCDTLNVDKCSLSLGQGEDVTSTFVSSAQSFTNNRRRKRATATFTTLEVLEVVPDPTYVAQELQWVSYTEATASQICQDYFAKNTVVQDCKKELNTDFIEAHQECVLSIQINDNDKHIEESLESVWSVCTAGASQINTTTSNDVVNKICEEQCQNGGCVNGKCTCYTDWAGGDCTIDRRVPPVVTGLSKEGKCSLPDKNSECGVVSLYGENFLSYGLTCHFMALQMDQNPYVSTGQEKTAPGVYESQNQVKCTVPAELMTSHLRWGVQVAVSNSLGARKTSWSTFVGYDPVCYLCSDKSCSDKANSCLIDGKCLASFAYKDGDVCHFCDPDTDRTAWTKKVAPPKCPDSNPTPQGTTSEPGDGTTQDQTTEKRTTTTTTTTTQKPGSSDKAVQDEEILDNKGTIIVVVVGCVCAAFIIMSAVLAVKLCQRREPYFDQDSSLKNGHRGSSDGSSDGNPKEFDNLAYGDFEDKQPGGISTFSPPSSGASAYPQKVVDMSAMEDDPSTRL